jgi:glycosyltransferase involved in cell wall biosynthesis
MLGGRPVVAADVGGLREVVGADGGVLVPPGSSTALAQAILALLDDPAAASALAAAARRRALTCFPLERCVQAHLDLYGRLTSSRAA